MLRLFSLLLAVQQAPAQAPAASAPPSPVARLVITPSSRSMTAGDTLRLAAQALDSSGRAIPNAEIRFMQAGAGFEASVNAEGLVTSGATGTVPVSVFAMVPGARPYVERVEIRMLPGPAARVEVTPAVQRLVAGQRVRLSAASYSSAGDERNDRIEWKSSAPSIARVTEDGYVTAVAAGRATITATAGAASTTVPVQIIANTIASVEVTPGRASGRQGDVIRFKAVAKDANGRPLSGLTPTWTFSPGEGMIESDGTFVGYEPGDYLVTANFGTRSADAVIRLEHRDVRRPLTVVGRLPRTQFSTEEVWLHPTAPVAYLGTGRGGDRMYAIDISDPANPVVTDSLMANTRRVNDVMTTPDGKFLVHTREGAADRKNGIVIASLEDPQHPKKIAEFTEGVTAGVHSAFVYHQEKHGTHVYLTNNGTGAIRGIL